MTGQAEQPHARVPDDVLDYDENLVYTYQGERFTGVGYDEVPGYGLSEISYVDGLQEGPTRDWYPSGQLKSEWMYRANARHGHSREYREDGTLVSEAIYEYGVRVRSRTFAEDGSVVDRFDLSEESPTFKLLQRLRARFG